MNISKTDKIVQEQERLSTTSVCVCVSDVYSPLLWNEMNTLVVDSSFYLIVNGGSDRNKVFRWLVIKTRVDSKFWIIQESSSNQRFQKFLKPFAFVPVCLPVCLCVCVRLDVCSCCPFQFRIVYPESLLLLLFFFFKSLIILRWICWINIPILERRKFLCIIK